MDTFWIVTAESARARIFKTASLIKEPVEVMDLAHPASRLKEVDLVADRPGRSQGSAGGGRHGMTNGDAHNHELEVFAREIADTLEQARQEGRYDKVILVAPPAWALAAMAAGGVWLCVVRGRVRFAGLAALGIGALAATQMAPADLVISGDGRLAAVRLDQGGYAFSTLRRGRFEREGWLAHAGFRDDQAVPWRRDGSETGSLRCDGEGCVLTRHGRRVVIAEGPAALAEDCGRADLVVALVPAGRRCRQAGPVIDFFDLWRKGAHAVHVTAKGIRVEAVNDTRGNRPWVLRPRGRQERDAD